MLAAPPLERSLRILEPRAGDVNLAARTRFALARALWDVPGERGRAADLLTKARAAFARNPPERARVEGWAAQHADAKNQP